MPAPLPIGELRHRLVLERSSTDATEAIVWTAVDTVFAAIAPRSATEAAGGEVLAGLVGHRIELRWRDDLTSRDRLRLGERIFRIVATHDLDETRRRLVVHAVEEGR